MERAVSAGRGLTLRSFAKINLGLEVLGIREDGYHELRTIFQTVDLWDDVRLEPRPFGVTVECDHPGVPTDERNLAAKAATALLRHTGVQRGVHITIRKRIPVAGGMGGGSSNAAVVLLGLDRVWKLGLPAPVLHRIARTLGADVPFFLVGGTALGIGRGEEIYPLALPLAAPVVVVDLQRPVSTADVFRAVDAALTPRENTRTISGFVAGGLQGDVPWGTLINELEPAALSVAPDLRERVEKIRAILIQGGSKLASLSGSGSSYFGVFGDLLRARRAQEALNAAGHPAFRVRTLSLDQYRRRVIWR